LAMRITILVICLAATQALGSQLYQYSVDVEVGKAARVDMPVDSAVNLTAYMNLVGGALDPATFQVIEISDDGDILDDQVHFQFDPDPDFNDSTNAVGNLVFVMNDTTAALATRHFQVLFDVVGACDDCPAPPAIPNPTTVDSLMYENQMTYLVDTPRAAYYYQKNGAGLASIIDTDGNDWIGFHDIPGSKTAGEYRGIPNLVFTEANTAASFFHPGFDNATSTIVNHGPLKVSIRSMTNTPTNEWIVLWEFYQNFARLTVNQVGTSNAGNYWFLYEGTPGGALDIGDVVVRSDGSVSSAFDKTDAWETSQDNQPWVYFHDTAASRYLYLCDDLDNLAPDSYRSQGQSSNSTPEMTVFGFGRVLNTTTDPLTPRISGTGNTFTLGFGEDNNTANAEINGAYLPLAISIGEPTTQVSASNDDIPYNLVLNQNFPNPFNPTTTISFNLPTDNAINLSVYDAAGRLVRTLVNEKMVAGSHSIVWQGRNAAGHPVASGIYLYRLVTPHQVLMGKMVLVE